MNKLSILIATIVILSSSAFGSDHITGILTLGDCFRLLQDRNPELQSARENIAAAQSRHRIAVGQRYPNLTAGVSYSAVTEVMEMEFPDQTVQLPPPADPISIPGRDVSFGDEDTAELRLSVGIPIYTGGQIGGNIRLSEVQVDLSHIEYRLMLQDLRSRLRALYYQFLKADNTVDIIQEDVKQRQRHLEEVHHRQKQGMAIRIDILEAQVALGKAQQDLLRMTNERECARLALLSILNLPHDSPITFSKEQWDQPPDPAELPQLDVPMEQRAEIAAIGLELAAADIKLTLANRARMPRLNFEGAGCWGRPGLDMVKNEWMAYAKAGLNLSFSLFQGGAIAAEAEEKQRIIRSLEARRYAIERQITLERQSARLSVNTAQGNWELAERLLETSEERLRVAQTMWQQGLASETAYQDARDALTQSQLSLSSAILDYRLAVVQLIKANGERVNP